MAIREEHDFLSENERKFLFDAIHDAPHVRADGRELMQQRKVRDAMRKLASIQQQDASTAGGFTDDDGVFSLCLL